MKQFSEHFRGVHLIYLLVLAVLFQVVFVTAPVLADDGWPSGEGPWQPSHPNIPEMDWPAPRNADEIDDFIPPGLLREDYPRPTNDVPVSSLPVDANVGRVMVFDNRLGTVVEDNTFDRLVTIELGRMDVVDVPISVTNTISNPIQSQALLRFDIEAEDVLTGRPIDQFPKPVRIVLDLRDLTGELNPNYRDFYLSYQDEEDPLVWHGVDITVHDDSGLISAEVLHFSGWEAGVRPDRWNPSFNQPGVSEFSGAATYSYPIEVPPGRNGLQPGVSLSYNSRSLDGLIQDPKQSSVADGWNIAETSISRVGVKIEWEWGIPSTNHPDKFRMVFNGTGHVLHPDVNANTEEDSVVRYYAKDAPGLLVKRYYDASTPNKDGIYWVITSADGTQYRLGHFEESEQYQKTNGVVDHLQIEGHEGHDNNYSGIVWNLDTVTDTSGNQMTYHYFEREVVETIDWYDNTYWQVMTLTTYDKRLNEIKYNYQTRVTDSVPFTTTIAQLTTTPASKVVFRDDDDDTTANTYEDPITSIYIYHNSGSVPTNEYRIDSEELYAESPGCKIEDAPGDPPRKSYTRVINSIQRFVNVDGDPSTTDSGTAYTLPATTFDYEYNPHFFKNSQACFQFYYLTDVENGYGGEFTFDYGTDERSVGSYIHNGSANYEWPKIGYNYFVTKTISFDGFNTSTVEYDYYKPCYNQTNSVDVGSMPDAFACSQTDASPHGNITGFWRTTVTTKDFAGSTLNVKKSYFHNANTTTNDKIGRLYQTDLFAPNGTTMLSQQKTTYAIEGMAGSGAKFTYADSVITTQYQNGATSDDISSKVTYDYEITYQGGVQYGNRTHVYEYRDAETTTTPYRTTRTWYFPNTTNWIVNKPGQIGVYEDTDWTELGLTWNIYDTGDEPSDPPTKGRLAKTDQRVSILCSEMPTATCGTNGVTARKTIESTITYDVYGNPLTTTSFADYGYYSYDSGGEEELSFPPTDDRKTTITYDASFNLYPTSVKNDLNQTTSFVIYGFGGGVNGFQEQTGLLKKVTDPNGNETKYEYDPFGRLHAVYDEFNNHGGFGNSDPWDGKPLNRYRYWDNFWNNGSYVRLDPANDDPFIIASHVRPNEWTVASDGYMFNSQTFFDGFGRPIQQHELYAEVFGPSNRRDIIVTTDYNARGSESCVTTPYDVETYADRETWPASAYVTTACTSIDVDQTTMTYDDRGRITTVTTPDGEVTTTSYTYKESITVGEDSHLLRTMVTDANGHATYSFTNVLGQLVLVRELAGVATGTLTTYADTRYFYDEVGNLEAVGTSNPTDTDPTTWLRYSTMTYNNFGQKTAMDDADMGQWTYDYNASGTLRWQKDANGDAICFTYDELDRLEVKFIDDNPANDSCQTPPTSGSNHLATYIYDTATNGVGMVHEVKWGSNPGSNRDKFYYDSRSRMYKQDRVLAGLGGKIMETTSFDALNRPLTVKYPDNEIVTYTYDHEGEETLKAGSDMLVTELKYNGRGQMARMDRGNDVLTDYVYFGADENFRLKMVDTWRPGSVPASRLDLNYTYDDVGNILTIVDDVSGDNQTFTYDHRNRLLTAEATGGYANYDETYTYDKLGNLLSITTPSQVNNYAYPIGSGDQPDAVEKVVKAAIPSPIPLYDFEYDDNGNMNERVDHTATLTYTQDFDIENRLITVTNNLTTTETIFTYDDRGQRISTVVEDAGNTRIVTYFPYPVYEVELHQEWACVEVGREGGGGCVWMWETQDTITRKTYSAGGQVIATRISGDPVTNNNGLFYFHSDHLGSATFLTHGNGHASEGNKVANSTKFYTPFGEYRIQPPSPTDEITDRGFTGHKHNDYIKLIYMNARFYLPEIGRFLTADTIVPNPANPQDFNRFSYGYNNPVKYSDPTGHYVVEADGSGAYECQYQEGCENMAQNPQLFGGSCGIGCSYHYSSSNGFRATETYHPKPRGSQERTPIPNNQTSLGCTKPLYECFQEGSLAEFENFQQINPGEFAKLLSLIAEELYYGWTPGFIEEAYFWKAPGFWPDPRTPVQAGRNAYDTPFYNNNDPSLNQQVCFGSTCWERSEVNYVAQGMWAAASGASLENTFFIIDAWNITQYGHPATSGEKYWAWYGYNWYLLWLGQGG